MSPVDPRSQFREFYDNPVIEALAPATRWTVSGRLREVEPDDPGSGRKAPIDIRHLMAGCNPGCKHTGPLRGAFTTDATCLMSLDELASALPDAANHAFYLNSAVDGVVVLDIESDCPPEIAADLLRLPGVLYSEVSMSGRGYHLVMDTPMNLHDFEAAVGKRKLQHERRWYEILFNHWITFTRRPVPHDRLDGQSPREFATIEDVYAHLAAHASVSAAGSSAAVVVEEDMPEIPSGPEIITATIKGSTKRRKALEDFDGDRSRWEFSVLGTLYAEMLVHLRLYGSMHLTGYSSGEQTWLLYQAALEVLPERTKHAEIRNGRPFLLDRAASLVADRQIRFQEENGSYAGS